MAFPAARSVATNGIQLALHEAGEGPAVLLLHGFPELAYSWRHQIGPLVDAGFRVLAPEQRGYGDSDAPADAQTYSVKTLVADAVGLLDALGIQQAVFVGHDWGSLPAWYSGVYAPDRVRGMASLCTPYFTPGETDTDGMEALLPQVEKHVIPDAGHWLQQERPDEVNALLVSWLQRHFAE